MPRKKTSAPPSPNASAQSRNFFDIPGAAVELLTTVPAVRSLIRTNKLKFIRIGHKMIISRQAIEDFRVAQEQYYDVAYSPMPEKVSKL
jgi:hypothetical protein